MKPQAVAFVLSVALVLSGCLGPGSKPFAPESPLEKQLYARAQRNVLPDDVRQNLPGYRSSIILWTGIIKVIEPTMIDGGAGSRLVVEHHYWDFIQDYGRQRAIAFLSPRGEGLFEAIFAVDMPADKVHAEDMAIVYGIPTGLSSDGGRVLVDGKILRVLPRDRYATDIWDYGREFLTKRDPKDFRVLRMP